MAVTVKNDPDAIRDYRGKIANAIENLKSQLTKTENAIETVSQDWKDNNFREFHENFNQDKEQIKPLCDVLSNYESNLLYQLEQKLRAYGDLPMHL